MTYISKTYYIKKTQTHSNEFRLTAQNWWKGPTFSSILTGGQTNRQTNKQQQKPYNTLRNPSTFIKPMRYLSKAYKILQNPYHTLTKFREGIDPMHIAANIWQISKIPCKTEWSIDGAGAGAGAGGEFWNFQASDRNRISLTQTRSFASPARTNETNTISRLGDVQKRRTTPNLRHTLHTYL